MTQAAGPITVARLESGLADAYAAVLCDLDGCLVSGETALPGALDFARSCGDRLWIVSNNSGDTGQSLSERLVRLGFQIPAHRILLAGEHALLDIAQRRPGARIFLAASAQLEQRARALGLIPLRAPERANDVDVVMLARDPDFGLGRLSKMVRLLASGAELVVTNPDLVHPGADGLPEPETGALLAALSACWPELAYQTIGKPQTALLSEALRRAGVSAADALFVGDNPLTDGLAAQRAGIAFLHVLPPVPRGPADPVASLAPAIQTGD
ncbi:HAD-IIA family hydrolase [Pannonibacter carbonis]|uniref:HAD-IIA family hydrolase n=1 Tax=Pannonibacter carbonis TaxID=2067569 RepID=UPI0018E53A2C|nr:HAD family hydrolase [Pannonibacter carbonis]